MESSERTCSVGEQLGTSSGTATAKRSSRRVFATASFLLPRSSGTFDDLSATDTPSAIAELRTWLAQASPASPSPWQESSSAPTTSETCGRQRGTAFAWFDRDTSCWRTSQGSLLADTPQWSSQTWPRWGMWDGGACWELPTLAPRMNGSGGGSERGWPTPTASDHQSERLENWLKRRDEKAAKGVNLQFALRHAVQMWPTPRANSAMAAATTPSAIANVDSRFPNLETVVAKRTWPTPNASDCRNRGNPTNPCVQRRMEIGKQVGLSMMVGGPETPQMSLNPVWVEWLMGWPIGWTDLRPLGTDKFHKWCDEHGNYSHD